VAYNEDGKSIAGMGADFKDVDNDGRPDIFVVGMVGDMFPLFRNRGRYFEDITRTSGVAKATVGFTAWGAGVFDFDNDGYKDLFAACASILDNSEEIDHLPSKLPNLLLRNLGNGTFADVSADAGGGFLAPAAHRGAAFGDLNNDGKIDIVVTNQNSKPEILMNRSRNANHWLIVTDWVRGSRFRLRPGRYSTITPPPASVMAVPATVACTSDWDPRPRWTNWRSRGRAESARPSRV